MVLRLLNVNNIQKIYRKPIIIKQSKMIFPTQVMDKQNNQGKILCRQCSSCHGCR